MRFQPVRLRRKIDLTPPAEFGRCALRIAEYVLLALVSLAPVSASAQVRLEGTIVDAETRVPLSGVHVLVVGTTAGTVSNAEGRFTLNVRRWPADLRVRHIGYVTKRLRIETPLPGELLIELDPAVLELDEIVVTGETFAENLMRKVLEQKRTWTGGLTAYEAQGFSRVVLERDASIVHLNEATFDQYWSREHGLRAVVSNVARTADWYDELPLEPAAYVPNFYDDYVEIQGLEFVGPTHPDALDRYTFRLAGRRMLNDQTVFDLYVSPRDERLATFVGLVSVLDSAFALVQVELRPARHVVFPTPLDAWRVAYLQRFEPVNDGPWLPIDLQTDGSVSVAIDARQRRVFDVHRRSQLSHYRLNDTLSDAVFAGSDRVTYAPSAALNDPLFIYGRVLMPLTAREAQAIERLRNDPLTLRTAFPPSDRGGRLAAFLEGSPGSSRLTWPTILGYEFRFRYNRVDGFLSSVGNTLALTPDLLVEWRLAQATALRRVRSHVRIRRGLGATGFAEFEYRRDVRSRQEGSRFSMATSSLQPLLGGDDYFDFYWMDGGRAAAGIALRGVTLAAEFTHETHRSVDRNVGKTWPFRDRFRPNPHIPEGTLGSASISASWTASTPSNLVRRAEVRAEHAPGLLPGVDFEFTRYRLEADVRIPTFFRRRPSPASLGFRVTAGASSGLPPQRYAVLDGTLSMLDVLRIGRYATFRSLSGRPLEGERHLAVFWEHDFITWPFERGILWPLAHRGMRVALFGGHGRTFISESTFDDLSFAPVFEGGFVHEVGLSLSRIGGTLLRIDAAARLDEPGFSFSLGASLPGR